jgi:hypothetical protein
LIDPKSPFERAVARIKGGSSLRAAAKSEGVREELLRRYLKENTNAKRVGRRWQIEDRRPRQYPFYSQGKLVSPRLSPEEATHAAHFMHAVAEFLPTGDEMLLKPFRGQGVRDISGKSHPFETDENTLYELDSSGELSFPEFYRIVA